eukprot:8794084-Alexandrium_andersonii.AAC.1
MCRAAAAAASRVHSTRVSGGRAASRGHLLVTATPRRAGGEGPCQFCPCDSSDDPSCGLAGVSQSARAEPSGA